MRSLLTALLLLPAAAAQEPPARHVLLVLLDDVGVDRIACYGRSPDPPATPNIDGLATRGVRFTRAWAQPYCGPSRAALLTGRYGYRTGIGTNVEHGRGVLGLPLEEWTLAEVLRAGSDGRIRTAAVGKWHLASLDQGLDHAREQGFERTALTRGNIGSYRSYNEIVGGALVPVRGYATSRSVDDAIGFVREFGEEPWFLYLPLHAAHVPFHDPPEELCDPPGEGDAARHKAAIEAADKELGRLLGALPEEARARTTVVVAGDNGTPRPAIEPPFLPHHGKGTMFEGSLHVPLIVAGAGVEARGTTCDALVSIVDLLPTVARLLGVDARAVVPEGRAVDGHDLTPLLADPLAQGPRRTLLAERFEPNHESPRARLWRAVRGPRFKLIRNVPEGRDRLYDLAADPHEQRELLQAGDLDDEARAALDRLRGVLEELPG